MNNQKQIATTHHYLAVGIKEQFEKEGVDNPGEVLKDGELELVYALYDYAVILTEAWNSLRHLKEGIGIFDYQISEVFAPKMFIAMSKKAEVINPELKGEFEMPCLIEWGQLCEKLITHWIKGTPGLSNGIEFMVYSNEKK
ncbi:hypothetical protein [Endozoicomonas sp. 4G]|uniref:hypothetical protein n=1 Tax=Endozoicomonas sp. 4G TaxID=2872754 RepID=UPI00207907AF|nr:hypothetical protein [Endozoicomonas sp. 4G]